MAEAKSRVVMACELHDFGVAIRRQRFVREHPDATESEIDSMLTAWLHDRPGAEFGDAVGRHIAVPQML